MRRDHVPHAPLATDLEFLRRGQSQYQIYCTPCHGAVGDGNGITKKYGMGATPTFHDPRLRTMPDGEIYNTIAEATTLSRKQVVSVFQAFEQVLAADLGKKGPGMMQVPGLMKVTVVRKPATKAREGINPFTGEKTIFKAKPARNVVKVRPMKNLKTMV